MTRNLTSVTTGLLLVLLLCTLSALLFTAHALPASDTENLATGAAAQACYTLDTSRPEWLQTSPVVYLPLVLRNHAP
ncbi:MAG: hypothetical protein JXA14_24020 [Anaerolineae bacterium]|nr:hypothetical protein [Anaerolineae bacterium]